MPTLPEGIYYAESLQAAGVAVNQNKVPYFYMRFNLTHVADSTQESGWRAAKNQTLRDVRLYLSEKARPYTEDKLEQLEFNGDYGNPQFGQGKVSGINLSCKHKKGNNNKIYEDWEICGLSGGEYEQEEADQDTIRKLNAQWETRAATKRKPQSEPTKTPEPTQTESEEGATVGQDAKHYDDLSF